MLKILKIIVLLSFILITILNCNRSENPVANSIENGPYPKAERHNLNGDILFELVTKIKEGKYGKVHALIIMRDDEVILEEYFRGYQRDDLHPLFSATKSIISALIGIAIHQGKINSVQDKMLSFFSEYQNNIANLDSLKERITIEDLLTMRSGLQWKGDDIDGMTMIESSDWIKFMLDLPMQDPPGNSFVYSSGNAMLLAGIINNSTGISPHEFAERHLFQPLGINRWEWETAPNGFSIGGWGLHLRPIDMVKIGQLFLRDGRWDNQQIIPGDWVKKSTQRVVIVDKAFDYAYQWWLYNENHKVGELLKTNDAFFAYGHGKQCIWIIPHLELVVVSTALNENNGFWSHALFWDYVLPAVKDR